MHNYTSKQLYMVNGGNKRCIYTDGFGDSYQATAEEELAWRNELIEQTLKQLNLEKNTAQLKMHIENLHFHNTNNLEAILIGKLNTPMQNVKIVLATCLWKYYKAEKSFMIIYECLQKNRNECINDVFTALHDFHNNIQAREFIISCIQHVDVELIRKAQATLSMWAYMGISKLRENNLLEHLKTKDSQEIEFTTAVQTLIRILT